jgi:hypothetical protein
LAAERDLGVMAIKAVSARPWAEGATRHAGTWYEPYTDDAGIERGVRFALSVPGVHAICTPGDVVIGPKAIAAAGAFAPIELESAVAAVAHETVIFPIPA